MKAHFFDIDVILSTSSKVWIVDKTVPNIPIMKISKSDFNLIKGGIYKSQENSIKFSGHNYWLPTEMMEILKVKAKNHRADISKELIENLEYTINIENILHLKNTDDDIYVICSKNNKSNYELMISKIEDELKNNGLFIKKFYYISETFYNRNSDDISYKKVRLLIQHLLGFKTEGDKLSDENIEQYNEVYYYDDEETSTKLASNSNNLLMVLLSNTESSLKDIIKDDLKSNPRTLFVNFVTGNRVNRFSITKVILQFSNLIKAFESFRFK
jgi:hypothetical protein